jgi:hypothetical protein
VHLDSALVLEYSHKRAAVCCSFQAREEMAIVRVPACEEFRRGGRCGSARHLMAKMIGTTAEWLLRR